MAITFRLASLLLLAALAFCSSARPYAPDDDAQVLERLPEKADPSLADLKRLRTALALQAMRNMEGIEGQSRPRVG